ncbi:hypothetical protein, partial [Frankia sp. AvcI1]
DVAKEYLRSKGLLS